MLAHGLPAARVFHIYNFAEPAREVPDSEVARLRAELGLPADAWVLLTPGRFVPVKGQVHLVEAMAAHGYGDELARKLEVPVAQLRSCRYRTTPRLERLTSPAQCRSERCGPKPDTRAMGTGRTSSHHFSRVRHG